MKNNVKENGLIYITVFSNSPDFKQLKNNIFHNKIHDTYISFFTKEEIKNLFSDFKPLLITESYFLDERQENTSYSGVIKYIGQKI